MLSCTRGFHPGPGRCLRGWDCTVPHQPPCSHALAGLRRQVEGLQGHRLTAELPCPSRFTCLHTRLPCPPPFLGRLEFTSRSPRWHWWQWFSQPAIKWLPWVIAAGLPESFHLTFFKSMFSFSSLPSKSLGGKSGRHLLIPLTETPKNAHRRMQHLSVSVSFRHGYAMIKYLLGQSVPQNKIKENK